jgi:hypothetical protein
MSLYAADRRYFAADVAGRLYRPGPYFAAKTLGVLPFALANVALCALIVYGMAGLRATLAAAAANCLVASLTYLIAQQMQALAAVVTRNEDGAFVLTIGWTAGARLFRAGLFCPGAGRERGCSMAEGMCLLPLPL